ncbi:MAG TPA: TAXI family TRAP transporter solute-binding subunit [Candidatus Limnocylindria bacterium]|nr:TAXI family TRAP transporter solute-binding subunit [Candidatus Limnocylindria bacterium]
MKTLRKTLVLALAISLLAGMAGVALADTQVSFGGSSSGGVMYYMAGAFANSVTPKTPGINISNITTGAAVDNAIKVSQGELDLSVTYSSLVYEAAQGTGNFADPGLAKLAQENLMGVGKAYDSDFYIVVFANSGINSIEDLNGKTVACGNPGSGAQYISDMVLDAFKINAKREYLAFSDTVYAMKEGRIQAVCQAGSPSGAVSELAETENIKVLPFTLEQIQALQQISPFFFPAEMAAGRYKGVDEPVLLPHFRNYIIANKDLDADVLYKMLEVAFQDDVMAELVAGHRNWAQFGEDNAAFEALGLKVHPGAVKFFEDHPEARRAY